MVTMFYVLLLLAKFLGLFIPSASGSVVTLDPHLDRPSRRRSLRMRGEDFRKDNAPISFYVDEQKGCVGRDSRI